MINPNFTGLTGFRAYVYAHGVEPPGCLRKRAVTPGRYLGLIFLSGCSHQVSLRVRTNTVRAVRPVAVRASTRRVVFAAAVCSF